MMAEMNEDGKLSEQSEELAADINTATVTIEQTAYKPSQSTSLNSSERESEDLVADRNTAIFTIEESAYKAERSMSLNIGETICVVATFIIFIILLCVLIYFEIKEHSN